MKVKISDYPKNKNERKVKIEFSNHDFWSLDSTLALIIAPALKKFKKCKGGIPGQFLTERCAELCSIPNKSKAQKKEFEKEEKISQKHYDDTLDTMIWSFEQIIDGYDTIAGTEEERKAYYDRVQLGLDNFAKYYTTLWN